MDFSERIDATAERREGEKLWRRRNRLMLTAEYITNEHWHLLTDEMMTELKAELSGETDYSPLP